MSQRSTVAVASKRDRCDTTSPPAWQAGRTIRAGWWVGAVVGLVFLLGALGYSETVLLHRDLPQDRVSRVALVIYPRPTGSLSLASVPSGWQRRLLAQAEDPSLLREVVATARLRDRASGQSWTPEQLRASMTLDLECLAVTDETGHTTRGTLLVAVARGVDARQSESALQVWLQVFQRRSLGTRSGLIAEPVETFRGTYAICR